jgi:radical SAM superfamily enzyme with C-terminal helix-hairpin-helix motif
VFGNLFAFFAGLGTAGLFGYLYPRMRAPRVGDVVVWRAGESLASRGFIDLNVATEEELQELAGIGPALSARIVENRPYRGKLELVSRMIIPEAVYERIKREIGVSDEAADASVEVAI